MSVKKISELNELTDEQIVNSNNVIMEIAVLKNAGYKTVYITKTDFVKNIYKRISQTSIEQILIDNNLCVEHGDISFNIDDPEANKKKFGVKFGEINLCAIGDDPGTINIQAQNQVSIKGNPININNNLSVWTNNLQSDKQVTFSNITNSIYVVDTNYTHSGYKMINVNDVRRYIG